MNTITLARFNALDRMKKLQAEAQLSLIITQISNATFADLKIIDNHLLFYQGIHKDKLKLLVDKCKACFPQYRQTIREKFKVNYMSQENRKQWKLKLLIAPISILAIVAAAIVGSLNQQGPNGQIIIKKSLSMPAIGIGIAGIVIELAFILSVYGFCGVCGRGAFKGIIDRELEQLEKRQAQTQSRLN